jgi:crotonobetainyl-CoA:carnitine CoA-transferase CaiB-like acyl-CoA transferase
LDLSRVLSGPFCTMFLADMGARVIKVERPGTGDETRGFGPPFVGGESTYFLSINRGKESVALDLKHPEGRALAEQLALQADVLVQNFRPGVVDRLGLDHESLSARNPGLVYASVSGFGLEGLPEFSRLPGYDIVVQGLGGIPSVTGAPDGPPSKVGTSIADLVAGFLALHGILLALYARERSGRGQHVDVSMLDGQVTLLTYLATLHWATGEVPPRLGNAHPSIAPYETFAASDGFINIAVANDAHFRGLAEVLGRPDLADDERFATNAARVGARDALKSVIDPIIATRTVEAWLEALSGAGLVCGPIHDVAAALAHPQLAARDMITEMEHPTAGLIKLLGSPWKMSGTPVGPTTPPPLLGQHTEAVLGELLGLDAARLAALREAGTIQSHEGDHG